MSKEVHPSNRGKLLIVILLIFVWSAFVYFAYSYSKDYFDFSIKQLDDKYYSNYENTVKEVEDLKREINNLKMDIRNLNTSIDSFNENMINIFDDVNNIDSVIKETSVLQEATTQKLDELDLRLMELIENLEILKKAPND